MTVVAVTGGAGFLGGHLVRQLVGAGVSVRILDAAPAPSWTDALGATSVLCDVRDERQVRQGIEGADVVVHAAFAPPRTGAAVMHEVNVAGTASVLAAAHDGGLRQVVLISSTIVTTAARSTGPMRSSGLGRLNAYRETRVLAEASAEAFRGRGLPVAIVRPKTFVGPDRVGAFAIVFELIRRGKTVVVPGSGRNRYQLLDIRDFATAVQLLVASGGDGVYGFGASRFGTVADDLGQLIRHAGTPARVRCLPAGAAKAGLRAVELAGLPPLSEWYHCGASGRDSVVDIRRAVDELGWEPLRSNVDALTGAYDWFLGLTAEGAAAPTTHPVPLAHRLLSAAARLVLR